MLEEVHVSPAANMDEAPSADMKPRAGRYRVDFYGQTVFYFNVSEDKRYTYDVVDQQLFNLFPKNPKSGLPASIHNMHPDHGMFGDLLQIKTKEELIGTGIKALSQIRIFPVDPVTGKVPERGHALDFKGESLSELINPEDDTLNADYDGPYGISGDPEFNATLKNSWVGTFNHRFSGKRQKLPATSLLKRIGGAVKKVISPAAGRHPFRFFFKYGTFGGREGDGLLEWAGMRMARAAGLKTAIFALVNQGEKLPPAYITERFDNPESPEAAKKEWTLMQDFYSIMGQDPHHDTRSRQPLLFRYDELMGGMIDFCNQHDPVNAESNAREFFKRLLVAWASNDGDLHAKNLSLLIRIDPETKTIRRVEFSPAYDACPSTICGLDGDPLFYNLCSKKGQAFEANPPRILNMNSFLEMLQSEKINKFGKRYGIFDTKEEAELFIQDVASNVANSAIESFLQVPDFVRKSEFGPMMMLDMQQVAYIAVKRAKSVGAQTHDIKFDPDLSRIVQKYGAGARHKAMQRTGLSGLYTELSKKATERGGALTVDIGAGPQMAMKAVFYPNKI